MKTWRSYKYKNLTLFFISIVGGLLLSRFKPFHEFLLGLGHWGYLGALLAGALHVSTFTVTTGVVILLTLAQKLSPMELGIIAGSGAVIGDLIIFRFVKDNLVKELELIYDHIDTDHHFKKVLHSKYFSWSLPVIGSLIIASPLPDEIGVSLLGISRMKTYKFLLFSFFLNATSILLTLSIYSFARS